MQKWKATSLAIAGVVIAGVASANDLAKPEVITRFDQGIEGLIAAPDGNLYTTTFMGNELYKVGPDGAKTMVADLSEAYGRDGGITVGIAFDGDDTIYIAHTADSAVRPLLQHVGEKLDLTCRDASVTETGLYAYSLSSGSVEPVVTKADGYGFCFPDDPVVAPDGSVYLSDLRLPGIWKIDPEAKKAELWSAHDLLWPGDRPSTGANSGPNGLAISADGSVLLAVTSGDPMLLKFPIQEDGSAGDPTIVAAGMGFLDGLEVDDAGNYYLTEGGHLRQEIWKISPNGHDRELIANNRTAPINTSASMAFWNDKLCVANLGVFEVTAPEDRYSLVCFSDLPQF